MNLLWYLKEFSLPLKMLKVSKEGTSGRESQ